MRNRLKKLILEELNKTVSEGAHDQNILKAIFIVGGSGSGKSYITSNLFNIQSLKNLYSSASSYGLKVVNSDIMFEKMLQDHNISLSKLGRIQIEDPKKWDEITKIRKKARDITYRQLDLYLEGRLGLILDTTGAEIEKIQKQRSSLLNLGYDVYLIFVNTSLEVALKRNQERGNIGGRTLSDDIVKNMWYKAQDNLINYKQMFGDDNTIEIENNEYKPLPTKYEKYIKKILSLPIKNKIGEDWINKNKSI
jgi:cytidylate kinase